MSLPRLVQIAVSSRPVPSTQDVLYALDEHGNVWQKIGLDLWRPVSPETDERS